ncbi:biliverdin reductase A isoform 4-T4 [Dama dama]
MCCLAYFRLEATLFCKELLQKETKMNTEPERKFGVVVVGVGRAGSVRIRDLRNPHASSAFLNLIGFVSRRELGSIDEVPQISLEDALSSQEVEVAFICSESSSHEDYIRQFLNAGKHVLVEYPMTLSWVAAKDLWELAEQKGKVLHEEHVELLMEEFAFLKKEVVGKDLLKGSLLFTGLSLVGSQVMCNCCPIGRRAVWLPCIQRHLSPDLAGLPLRGAFSCVCHFGRAKGRPIYEDDSVLGDREQKPADLD